MTAQPPPHPIAPGLHLLPPWLPLTILLSLLMAALALFIWWRLKRARTARPQQEQRPSTSPRASDGFVLLVDRIEAEHLESRSYREGLHALAAAMRSRIEKLANVPAEEWTVREIERVIDDSTIAQLLRDLRRQRFAKKAPTSKSFKRMCSRTRKSLAGRKSIGMRR